MTAELVVIGAGPAGLAAASAAAAHGAAVTVIDESSRPGGQYFRQAATASLSRIRPAIIETKKRKGAALLRIIEDPRVTYLSDTTVFEISRSGAICAVRGKDVLHLKPRCTIVATGATERPVPFPGWTLPGVMGAGALQNLLRVQRSLPGRRILVAGNGPLALLAASNLARLGAEVACVVEAASARVDWRRIPDLMMEPEILGRGILYRLHLLKARVPVRSGHVLIEARGDPRVAEAVVAPIDRQGRIDRSRAQAFAVDTIITGFGLVPATEITRALGCRHGFDPAKGGWIPLRSADLETTIPNCFAVGECAGAAGVENAILEGSLAGLVAAMRIGESGGAGLPEPLRRMRSRLKRLGRFRRAIEEIYEPPASFLELIESQTIVCRCEEVEAQQIARQFSTGVSEVNSLKAVTRASMGRCQGRNCLPTITAMIARLRGCAIKDVALPTSRPPMRPVEMGALAGDDLADRGGPLQ